MMTKFSFLGFNPLTLDYYCESLWIKHGLPNAIWNGKDNAVLIVKASMEPHRLSLLNTRAVN